MRMDNKGLSMVELLIVVAIMAVLAGTLTVGVSAAFSKPADECAEKIATVLSNARITTMGKQNLELQFYTKDDCIYLKEIVTAADGTVSTRESKISKKGVTVEYKLTGGGSYVPLGNSSSPLTLSFKRSTGGFNPCSGGSYCEEIRVTKGSRVRIIKLAYLTGKVMIED